MNSTTQPERIWGASKGLEIISDDKSDDKDELVNLIAYSLFKLEQSEWAKETKPTREEVDKHHQTLQTSRVKSLRDNAKSRLNERITATQKEWRKALFDEIRKEVADTVAAEIEERVTDRLSQDLKHIKNSTSFKSALMANVAGWLVSIGLTAIVILGTFLLTPVEVITKIVER
ncbi:MULTISPECIES: hypothetical protein [unclassified Agrobacterium]|uniref:hypothetical protein n=1 Tax=unclassified Agrobacterium TaxID=2632611 RepID=UPI0024471F92|nr:MULTISPECIES: hypothetical protein [unclassified Agrobacterium]MDH0614362.1 hypothetical protein [Agrobacterium sp. GD03872]MDH0695343.1 hypothetical protein [Agrobacterium sp. GD03871]MDH1058245.1 hypothetical protein [Agrobacterium sp. GD03992]MDH2209813.1 hypothetical protein [Agrobacterium sp. GD03643]MDH2219218.1 hypothetical protein [Agrobacterium sp. GD03638]